MAAGPQPQPDGQAAALAVSGRLSGPPPFQKDVFVATSLLRRNSGSSARPNCVDKNSEGYWNEDAHLAMYQYSSQVPNPPLGTVYTRDQFDERKIDPGGSFLLGVPTKKWL